jgi:transcription elongation GreA/GreB family factor
MNKTIILQQIVQRLEADSRLLLQAAKTAHAAATHEENIPDNKYATLALEASYLAQGQANRAQELNLALEAYRQLQLQNFGIGTPIRLTALVVLEDEEGEERRLFLGPAAGGLRLVIADTELMVITPESPLGRQLLGLRCGESCELEVAGKRKEYEIVDVC